jgi:CRP-like cAMP-binding protein
MNLKETPVSIAQRSSEEKRAVHSAFPVFAPLLSDGFRSIRELPAEEELPVGSVLVEQAMNPGSVYLLHRGLVKLLYVSAEGDEKTLGLRTSGWYPGAVSALMNIPSVYSVVAVTSCTISRIPAREFSFRLMQSAKLMRHFLATLCSEVISQAGAQAQVMSGSAEDRLVHFMFERDAQHPKWKTLDPLPLLKQMELAQLLSITPEHLSRLLHKEGRGGLKRSTRRTA